MEQLNFNRRLIAPCAVSIRENNGIKFNLKSFINRLIIFDTYILQSARLKEIPLFIRYFGYDGTKKLLSSNSIKLNYDIMAVGQLERKSKSMGVEVKTLPKYCYEFSVIKVMDKFNDKNITLDSIRSISGLKLKEKLELEDLVNGATFPCLEKFGAKALNQMYYDLRNEEALIKKSINAVFLKDTGIEINDSDYSIKIHQIGSDHFKVDNNLASKVNISEEKVHKLIESALLSIGRLNIRFEEMEYFSAMSGFINSEIGFPQNKLMFLLSKVNPNKIENNINRIVDLKFPDIDFENKKIDICRLLEIRQSPECIAFRDWIGNIDTLTDKEIQDQMSSFNSKLPSWLRARDGTALKFLAKTLIGSLYPPAGLAVGVLDQFVFDKVIPKNGPIMFINNMYPSIFK